MFIPKDIEQNVYEGFDPILVSGEVIETHFAKLLDTVLNSSGNDAQFIEEMKDAFAAFIGEWIDELQDGFANGMSDVVIFFRENLKVMIEAGAGPEMGMMLSGMGTDTVMKYITLAYNRYKSNKEKLKAAKTQQQNQPPVPQQQQQHQQEDVKMEDEEEEEKEET